MKKLVAAILVAVILVGGTTLYVSSSVSYESAAARPNGGMNDPPDGTGRL
ncbi:hypothetical protein [Paenibacillus sp. PL2-23]